jgi:hypothetical protein
MIDQYYYKVQDLLYIKNSGHVTNYFFSGVIHRDEIQTFAMVVISETLARTGSIRRLHLTQANVVF